jgi:transposase
MRMKKHPQFFISKRPRRSPWVGITIGIDLGDIWSHYCTLNENGEVIDRGRFRTNAAGVNKRFGGIDTALVAMENGTHSITRVEEEPAVASQLSHQLNFAIRHRHAPHR